VIRAEDCAAAEVHRLALGEVLYRARRPEDRERLRARRLVRSYQSRRGSDRRGY
jgi:hypothetical protein